MHQEIAVSLYRYVNRADVYCTSLKRSGKSVPDSLLEGRPHSRRRRRHRHCHPVMYNMPSELSRRLPAISLVQGHAKSFSKKLPRYLGNDGADTASFART